MLHPMQGPAIVFRHTGLTVHAAPTGELWRGELIDVTASFSASIHRETFPAR